MDNQRLYAAALGVNEDDLRATRVFMIGDFEVRMYGTVEEARSYCSWMRKRMEQLDPEVET